MTTADASVGEELGERLIGALAGQDWPALEACFDSRVSFRALIPPGLREGEGKAEAGGYLRTWFGDADELVLPESEVQPIEDRLSIRYRFRAHEDAWYVVEQQAYCEVQQGKITKMHLLCSGFRPASAQSSQERL
jgi:hypothetical protein